jgi:hypothetical protein
MKYVINILMFGVMGVTLHTTGATFKTWQYWSVLLCAVTLCINAVLW